MNKLKNVVLPKLHRTTEVPCIICADSDFDSLTGKEISLLDDLISLASQDEEFLNRLYAESTQPSKQVLFRRLSDIYEKVTKSISNEFLYDE